LDENNKALKSGAAALRSNEKVTFIKHEEANKKIQTLQDQLNKLEQLVQSKFATPLILTL